MVSLSLSLSRAALAPTECEHTTPASLFAWERAASVRRLAKACTSMRSSWRHAGPTVVTRPRLRIAPHAGIASLSLSCSLSLALVSCSLSLSCFLSLLLSLSCSLSLSLSRSRSLSLSLSCSLSLSLSLSLSSSLLLARSLARSFAFMDPSHAYLTRTHAAGNAPRAACAAPANDAAILSAHTTRRRPRLRNQRLRNQRLAISACAISACTISAYAISA